MRAFLKSHKPLAKCLVKESLNKEKHLKKKILKDMFSQAAQKNKKFKEKLKRKKEHLIFKTFKRERTRKEQSLFIKTTFSWTQLTF